MNPETQNIVPPQQTQHNLVLGQVVQARAVTADPGKTMAITGLVIVPFSGVFGLVVSLLANKKSKAAGFKSRLALTGIVLNIISIIISISILSLVLLGDESQLSNNGESNKALGNSIAVDPNSELGRGITRLDLIEKTSNAKNNAMQLVERASKYKQHTGDYPKSITNFKEYPDTLIPATAEKHVASSKPTRSSEIQAYYQYCGSNSAQVLYYNHSDSKVDSLGIGLKTDGALSCK